jgi:hypothetical protein
VSQQLKKTTKRKKTNRGPLILVGLGVVLVILVAVFALRRPASGSPPASFTPDVKGAAAIRADKDKVDLGDMKLGATADVSFTVTNTGDQPLRFTKQPYVEVKEGC